MQYTTNQLKIRYKACNGLRSLLFDTFIKLKREFVNIITFAWGNGLVKPVHNVVVRLVKLVNFIQVIDKTYWQGLKPGLKAFIKFTHNYIIPVTETTGC